MNAKSFEVVVVSESLFHSQQKDEVGNYLNKKNCMYICSWLYILYILSLKCPDADEKAVFNYHVADIANICRATGTIRSL